MPATSKAQQRAAGADKARCAKGEAPKTFPSCEVAEKFAHAPGGTLKGLPARKDRPQGSPPFTDQELRQGYRKIP